MNKILRNLLFITLVCLTSAGGFAQKKKIVEKANKEFDKFSYIDARAIYLKVVEEGYDSAEIFEKLGDTYYFNGDYDNAAKWYLQLAQKYPNQSEPIYYYRAAQSLKSLNKYEESDAMMLLYKANGGEGLVIQNFENDPEYLKSIGIQAKSYKLDKVEINTKGSDFGPSFFGNKIVFASSTKTEGSKVAQWNQQPFLDLFEATADADGKLSNVNALAGDVNTRFHESSATFSKDGRTMYFTRNNFTDGKKGKDSNKTIRLKLYKATKSGDNFWTNVVELPFNGKEFSTAHPALSPDGKKLYFASDRPGTNGMSDLWYVDIIGDSSYGEPVNLGKEINTETRESFPFISEKGFLYFSSDGRSGLGGLDIYITDLNATESPAKIVNLGKPANSNKDDFGYIVNEDRHLGYLTSNRDGNRGSVDDEIYRILDKCQIEITGLVTDIDTGELLPGAEVNLLDENNKLVLKMKVGNDARYTFMAECDTNYILRGTKENYSPYEKPLKTPAESGKIIVPIPLKKIDPCPPNDIGCRLSLQPIYFDFDRFNIRPDAAVELAKIYAAMIEYPQLIIKIESHTDSRGNDKYNELLSEKRAQSTLKWLVDKGIAKSRLSAKGYGEYRLLVEKCTNGVECTEEEHQLNRRSMFLIVN